MRLTFQKRYPTALPVLLTLLLTGFIGISNHLAFRTFALDLGLYTHHAWSYFNGQTPDLSMVGLETHALADHFDFYLIFFSPFVAIGGAWALIVIQWLSYGAGCLFAVRLSGRERLGIFLGLYFLVLWPVVHSAGFDYHSNVIAAMLWLLWWKLMLTGQHRHSWLVIILMWVGKEDLPLWMSFSALGGAMLHRSYRKTFLWQAAASFTFFLLVIGVFMPTFPAEGAISNLGKYSRLEQLFHDFPSSFETIRTLLNALVSSPAGGIIDGKDVRHEFWIFFLFSGGWMLLRRPSFLVMLLPLIFSKMWHDNPLFGGTLAHHNIALVPVFIAAAHDFLTRTPRKTLWALVLIIPSLVITMRSLDNPVNRSMIDNTRFYQLDKFLPDNHTQTAALLEQVPADASVSAMAAFVPCLATREHIYQFPIKQDQVDYVVLSLRENTYPLSTDERDAQLNTYTSNRGWQQIGESPIAVVFKRQAPP